MAATAVARVETSAKAKSAHVERKRPARVHAKRRMKTKVWRATMVSLFFAGLCLPFVYATVYATLATTGYSKSDYEVLCWKQRVENQRLKVLADRYTSYDRIKAGAIKMGMVRAENYDYLDQPQTVASR